MYRSRFVIAVIVLGLSMVSLSDTSAQVTADRGISLTPGREATVDADLGIIDPVATFPDSLYSTGGTPLRNHSEGEIELSGNGTPPPPATACFVYWAVITEGPFVPGLQDRVSVVKKDPKLSAVVTLTGAAIGVGPDPCWPGDTITVFKAAIPLAVCNASPVAGGSHAGVFQVRIKSAAAAGSFLGEDPWVAAVPPLWEGASIVAVWPSVGNTTLIYDVGLAGTTFSGTLSYGLALPAAPAGTLLWDNIGADGQHGFSRTSIAGVSDEVTTIGACTVAGPGSSYNDSDWNGNDGNPLPSLWDTTGHDVSGCVVGPIMPVSFAAGADCLTPVANIVAE